MLKETLRSRWFSAGLHAGLWLLLVMVVAGLGGRRPQFAETDADPLAVQKPVPVAKLEKLFEPVNWPKHVVDPASQNVFATSHFIPPVVPTPPPTTKRIELTYQGYYQTGDGPQRTLMRLGDALVAVPVGGVVVSNLWVADAGFQTLTLTNSAGQTNVLGLNVKKEVEVPLK
jgi:hypothetical protein